jgi:hypothetical protein
MFKLQDEEITLLLESYKKPIILKDDWVLVNKKEYNKNKNKITLNIADFHSNKQVIKQEGYKDYTNKQVLINAETKNKYILIKYNSNFVAVNVSDTEYGITINPMRLICARNIDNLEEHKEIPSFEYLLYILGWKITNKALNNIKKQDDYF